MVSDQVGEAIADPVTIGSFSDALILDEVTAVENGAVPFEPETIHGYEGD